MSATHKRKHRLIVVLIQIAEWLTAISIGGLALCSLLILYGKGHLHIPAPAWVGWLAFAAALGLGALLLFLKFFGEDYATKKAGYGIGALESTVSEEDRTVMADNFTVTEAQGTPSGYGYIVEVPWTRVRVRHMGKIPCVMEVVKGNTKRIRFFDNTAYMEWKRKGETQRSVPKKVKIEGRKVPTACPEEMIPWVMDKAERIFDAPDIAEVKGIVRIEPDQVVFMQKGDPLEGEYLRMVRNLLVRLAEKTEKEYK